MLWARYVGVFIPYHFQSSHNRAMQKQYRCWHLEAGQAGTNVVEGRGWQWGTSSIWYIQSPIKLCLLRIHHIEVTIQCLSYPSHFLGHNSWNFYWGSGLGLWHESYGMHRSFPERREETDLLMEEIMGKSIESELSAMCLRDEEGLAISVLWGKRRYHSVYCSDSLIWRRRPCLWVGTVQYTAARWMKCTGRRRHDLDGSPFSHPFPDIPFFSE